MARLSVDDTIVAIASAAGGSLRGILRISGPETVELLSRVAEPAGAETDWRAVRRARRVPAQLVMAPVPLPCDVYVWPNARSYTGQPAAELHTIGSPPLLQRAVRWVCQHGARLAEPGEFTLRAFLAGRLDLTQAEAVLGVIDANSHQQFQQALSQLAGGMSAPLQELRDQLLDLTADLEAGLDFVEEDIAFITSQELEQRLTDAVSFVVRVRAQLSQRNREQAAHQVVLLGAPNVGKSSLWNALVAGASALVSPTPGTTRDYLKAAWQLGDWSCELTDTAGVDLQRFVDGPDHLAQHATERQATQADVRLVCLDASRAMTPAEQALVTRWRDDTTLIVLTKCDLPSKTDYTGPAVKTSCVQGAGVAQLRKQVESVLERLPASSGGMLATTIARCHDSLYATELALKAALQLATCGGGDELVAAELRNALQELGGIVGAIYTDDVLDRVFSRFCIGK